MVGITIVLDLLRKSPNFYTPHSLHSSGFFSASAAASTAAASVAAGMPFAYRALFGNFGVPVAYCDAGAALSEDYVSNLRSASEKIFQSDSLKYSMKEYRVELKPLSSAFEFRVLAMTSLRSFLMFYLPLLEPRANLEDDDDDDFLQDAHEEQHVDYVVPFKKSVKQIIRETTVVTTRRILERIAFHYASQRLAWKLLKDVPKSATRKAVRGMPKYVFFFRVSRTTFRGHFLGVAASWVVQVAIEIYRFLSRSLKSKEGDEVDTEEQAQVLGKKISAATVRCGFSLIFASIGAGIGATLFRPSAGQWIGCAVGDLAGPIFVSYCFGKVFLTDL